MCPLKSTNNRAFYNDMFKQMVEEDKLAKTNILCNGVELAGDQS